MDFDGQAEFRRVGIPRHNAQRGLVITGFGPGRNGNRYLELSALGDIDREQ